MTGSQTRTVETLDSLNNLVHPSFSRRRLRMPYSNKQQIAARIAEHEPGKLFARNKGMAMMSGEELHKMATEKIKPKKGGKMQHIGKMVRKPRGRD
mgnify:CR=1 FL=1